MKAPTDPKHTGHAARHGVAGFHRDPQAEVLPEGSGAPATPAGMQLDGDTAGRVNTGTGDQPGNTGGSRTGTPPPAPIGSPDVIAPQRPDNSGSTDEDLDHERTDGASGERRSIH